jgi:ribonuclease VapC
MVIDTSALLAILNNEPAAVAFEAAVETDPSRLMSVGTYLETATVVESRKGEAGGGELDLWLHRAEVELVPVDVEHADLARSAYRRYGKGRHPAGLNYGDCFAYALANSSAEPLLFKGEDFSHTELASVELSSA